MKKTFVLLATALLLGGCATVNLTGPVIPEKVEVFKPYPQGVPLIRSVGDQMIGYSLLLRTLAYPGFVATEDFQPPAFALGQNVPLIKTGSEWKAISKIKEGGYLCSNESGNFNAIIPGATGTFGICLLVDKDGEPYGTATCGTTEAYASTWKNKPSNFLKPTTLFKKDDKIWRKAAIVYAGKTKESIRFLYRETALRDMEFTFDLSESNIIAIKDITFEIIEATNIGIKYIIRTSPDELKSKIEIREKEQAGQDI